MGVEFYARNAENTDWILISLEGSSHNPVTLGAGSDPALSLANQELTLADVLTPTEHSAIGNDSPHHAPVSLGGGNYNALSLSGQEFTLSQAILDSRYALVARILSAGNGLVGGGDLSADRSFGVGAGSGITVNADDVALNWGTPTISTIQPNDGADAGVSENPARSDHKHHIVTGAPENPSVNLSASSEGAGASFARADHSHQLDVSIVPTWSGEHTFEASMVARAIDPQLSNTYDLGSADKLWRKAYVSEFSGMIFSETEISAIGSYFYISKDRGALPSDVADDATEIDFGRNMTPGDFIQLMSAGQVEWMEIGDLVSGTTYEVTRNLDGSGADAWVAGTVFVVMGQEGNGHIEMVAYDGPKISVFQQGAAYNSSIEGVRLGNLNGIGDYGSEIHGMFVGNYAEDKWLSYDPTNGLRIKGDALIDGSLTAQMILAGSGFFQAGSGTKDADLTGFNIDASEIVGQNVGVDQVVIGADGKLYAGAGNVKLDEDGLTFTQGLSDGSKIKWIGFTNETAMGDVSSSTYEFAAIPTLPITVTCEGVRINFSDSTLSENEAWMFWGVDTTYGASYIFAKASSGFHIDGNLYLSDVAYGTSIYGKTGVAGWLGPQPSTWSIVGGTGGVTLILGFGGGDESQVPGSAYFTGLTKGISTDLSSGFVYDQDVLILKADVVGQADILKVRNNDDTVASSTRILFGTKDASGDDLWAGIESASVNVTAGSEATKLLFYVTRDGSLWSPFYINYNGNMFITPFDDGHALLYATTVSDSGFVGAFIGRHARGTSASPTSVVADSELARFEGRGYKSTGTPGFGYQNGLAFWSSETWDETHRGCYMTVHLTPNASTTRTLVFKIEGDGTLNFGTYSAKGAEAFAGYITIKDLAGNARKVMICA